jgi:hypothetical protein
METSAKLVHVYISILLPWYLLLAGLLSAASECSEKKFLFLMRLWFESVNSLRFGFKFVKLDVAYISPELKCVSSVST